MLKFFTTVAIMVVLIASALHDELTAGEQQAMDTLSALNAAVFIPLLMLAHRLLLSWQVKRMMFSNAGAEGAHGAEAEKVDERPAERMPRIEEFRADSVPDEARALREDLVRVLSARARRSLWTSLAATAALAALPPLVGRYTAGDFEPVWVDYNLLLFWYAVIVVARYRMVMSDLRPEGRDLGFSAWDLHPYRMAWLAVVTLLRSVANPRADLSLVLILGAMLAVVAHPGLGLEDEEGVRRASTSLGFFVAACGVWLAYALDSAVRYFRPGEDPRLNPNIRLLILRVFGRASAARFTFDRVVRFWKSFGPHFTVDDPSLARFRNRIFQWKTLVQLAFVTVVALINPLSGLAVLGILVAYDWLLERQRAPVATHEQVLDRLRDVVYRPQHRNGTYRALEMVCHMDTWKMVVSEYVRHAHVVLMDLRDYSAERGGSQYEVNFIFDRFPIDQIVFLRDTETDAKAVREMILEMWRELRVGSPNEKLADPVVRVFVTGTQDSHDVQALLDLLLVAGRRAAEGAAGEGGEGGDPRRLLPKALTDEATYFPGS